MPVSAATGTSSAKALVSPTDFTLWSMTGCPWLVSVSPRRTRFATPFSTEAAPEIKFRPHDTDSFEEALCNRGAAALLMPTDDVFSQVKSKDVSLDTLDELSQRYAVSMEAAFLRLRALRLWNCEMTVWHRMMTGEFVLDRIHGWLKLDWRWVDSSIPDKAWARPKGAPVSGRSFVYFERPDGYSAAEPMYYQTRRRGNSLVAIWGPKRLDAVPKPVNLFR